MAFTYIYKRGDTWPPITATLGDGNGPFDLTGHTVRLIVSPAAAGAPPLLNVVAAVPNPTAGAVSYTPGANDLSIIGSYRVEWEDILPSGAIRRLPTNDFDSLTVGPNAEDEIAGAQAPAAAPARPLTQDFEMVKGNRHVLRFALPLRNESNALIDVGAYLQVWFYAKRSAGDVDPGLIAKTKGSGVGSSTTILVNPVVAGVAAGPNVFEVYLLPADTATIEPGYENNLWYECRALVATNDIRTIARGWLKLGASAVNAIT